MKKCSDCEQSHDRLSKRCRTCLDKENLRQKEQYQKRLCDGLCPRCGQQPMSDSKHCNKCAERVREKDRSVRLSRFTKGMCVSCGDNTPSDSLRTCKNCLLRLGDIYKKRAEKLNNLNLCVRCGKSKQLSGHTRTGKSHTTCQTCYLKHISFSNLGTRKHAVVLMSKLKAQNYKCPYTGEDLILGDNAWIDHIMPRSRFPELSNDIDNIEWLTGKVNRMKQDRTPKEFLSLIKKIHDCCEL